MKKSIKRSPMLLRPLSFFQTNSHPKIRAEISVVAGDLPVKITLKQTRRSYRIVVYR